MSIKNATLGWHFLLMPTIVYTTALVALKSSFTSAALVFSLFRVKKY